MTPPTTERDLAGVSTRLLTASGVLLAVVLGGTFAYSLIGNGNWSLFDCFYMTVITLSTVGFGETLPGMNESVEARLVTMGLIVVGSGTLLYFISGLTALLVEGDLRDLLQRRRMQKVIDATENHIVICGAGSTGEHCIRELIASRTPYVVIDQNPARVDALSADLNAEILLVAGDATDDHTLQAAGIGRAKGVIAALHDDKDNLFVTISARHLSKRARIVAKAVESSTIPKLKRAGADAVVSPNQIGGFRLVSEMMRPNAVEFLDRMMRDDQALRIEDAAVPNGSNLVGRSLANAAIRDTGVLVIAIRNPEGKYFYNPPSAHIIEAGSVLVVIAHAKDLEKLRHGLSHDLLLRS